MQPGAEAESRLAGTWDLVVTTDTSVGMGVLSLNENAGTITLDETTGTAAVDGNGNGTGSWQDGIGSAGCSIEHTGAAVDTGEIPLDLGGDWTFASTEDLDARCTSLLQPSRFTNTCTRSWQILGASAEMTATRVTAEESIFGDLGGSWTFVAGSSECTVTLAGATFSASCDGGADTVSATVADGLASGTSTFGFEFTAQRR